MPEARKKVKIRPLDLHQAVWNRDVCAVRVLLEHGADPNHFSGGRSHLALTTPLFLAIRLATWERSEWNRGLHEAAAELSLKLIHPDPEASRKALIKIMRLLIAHGVDANQLSPSRSPLNWAADRGDGEIVKLLIEARADPSGVSYSTASKLSHRVGREFIEGFYGTALHAASEKGHLQIVKLLIQAGADRSRKNHEGRTPAQIALAAGHSEVAEYLTECEKR